MQNQQMPYGGNGGGHRPVVCPYGGDVFQGYTCVINQMRQNKGLPAASFKLSSVQRLVSNQQEQQVIQAIFEMDLHDGKGPRKAVIDNIHAIGAASTAQARAADQRREASSAAFNNHMNAINQNSGDFNSHMDDIDRSSKAFQDYTLDRSVVRDNDLSERGTVNNGYADSLVRANPDRFEIVPNQNLIKGLDY